MGYQQDLESGLNQEKSIQNESGEKAALLDMEEKIRQQEKRAQYFDWMMEEYVGNIYISDMDNYELLYINKVACETLGNKKEELLGRKCYEVIQGRDTPCPSARMTDCAKKNFINGNFTIRFWNGLL